MVIAPGADEAAKAVFAAKKNLRLLITDGLPDPLQPGQVFRSVAGGLLVQSRDLARITPADLKIVTKRQPSDEEVRDMLFAFTVAKHVKSNAIVYAKAGQTAGIGAGQMNRRDSARDHLTTVRNAEQVLSIACGKVEIERWTVDGTHAFDEPTGAGPMRHDEALTNEALERFATFLKAALAAQAAGLR